MFKSLFCLILMQRFMRTLQVCPITHKHEQLPEASLLLAKIEVLLKHKPIIPVLSFLSCDICVLILRMRPISL